MNNQLNELPDMQRIVIGVDPSGSAGEKADREKGNDIGIVAAALGVDGRGYVLGDFTCNMSPDGWGRRVVECYYHFTADRIVAERNFGGAMVEHVIRTVDKTVPLKVVTASRGKVARAEPVAALFEQGKIKMAASMPELEDELCLVAGTLIETSSGLVPIENIRSGDLVATRNGLAPVKWAGQTGEASELIRLFTNSSVLEVTPCHPIGSQDEFVCAKNVGLSDRLLVSRKWEDSARRLLGEEIGITEQLGGILKTRNIGLDCCIELFMRRISDLFQRESISIIETAIRVITGFRTWNVLAHQNIIGSTLREDGMNYLFDPSPEKATAWFVGRSSKLDLPDTCIARTVVRKELVVREKPCPVFNLKVGDGYLPEYFANGVLAHNCCMTPDGFIGGGSPNRCDAMVWAITDLMLTHRFIPPPDMSVGLPR